MTGDLQDQAKRHLWMHFTRMGSYADAEVPVIVRGEGCYVYDEHGTSASAKEPIRVKCIHRCRLAWS